MTLQSKPQPDELEVSVFGPGVGECVVVHLGAGRWMVVDSCIDAVAKVPVALKYLAELGVHVERDVVRIVVTHWHDDHTLGIASVLSACKNAELYFSRAMGRDEILQVLASANSLELEDIGGSGVTEMAKVFEVLKERKRAAGSTSRTLSPRYADANTLVYRDATASCVVQALSPSANSHTRSLANLVPVLKAPKKVLPNPGPNELSVVLHVQLGDIAALLGADLEIGTSTDVGWRAVVTNSTNPQTRALIVKVPHHGSRGADHPPMWASMLAPDATAAVTSFTTSSLPGDADVARVTGRGHDLFHTSPGAPPKAQFDRTTERTLEGIKVRERRAAMGHVRLRARGTAVTHELFGGARQR